MSKLLTILFILISFNYYSQDTIPRKKYLIDGCIITSASILPHYVAFTTYLYNKNNPYSYLYTGVWFSFGVSLDIVASQHFIKYHKLKHGK